MNILKKIVGGLLISLVLGGLAAATVIILGASQALLSWGISMVLTAVIVAGVCLLVD